MHHVTRTRTQRNCFERFSNRGLSSERVLVSRTQQGTQATQAGWSLSRWIRPDGSITRPFSALAVAPRGPRENPTSLPPDPVPPPPHPAAPQPSLRGCGLAGGGGRALLVAENRARFMSGRRRPITSLAAFIPEAGGLAWQRQWDLELVLVIWELALGFDSILW